MPDSYRMLRHSIRGAINALKLGASAMDTGLTDEEAVEFLDYITRATDKMTALLDQYEQLPWPPAADQSDAPATTISDLRHLL